MKIKKCIGKVLRIFLYKENGIHNSSKFWSDTSDTQGRLSIRRQTFHNTEMK